MSVGTDNDGPKQKKRRVDAKTTAMAFELCQQLLEVTVGKDRIPPSLLKGGIAKNSISKLRNIFDQHKFRTSVVQSPREGLSLYKDSFVIDAYEKSQGRLFLVTMFGLHPQHNELEQTYKSHFHSLHCLLLFCQRLRQVVPKDVLNSNNQQLDSLMAENEQLFGSLANDRDQSLQSRMAKSFSLSSSIEQRVTRSISVVNQAEPKLRMEQLTREYQRIQVWNSTLSNSLVSAFQKSHQCHIKEIRFKACSQQPKFERFTVYVYDSNVDLSKPPHFLFLPCLNTAIEKGSEAVVTEMIASFWGHLLRHGYFATSTLKNMLKNDFQRFLMSGIAHDPRTPLLLNAHFDPNSALSLYLHGKAGSGKSSFVRNFQPALEATVEEHMDPEILVRYVKQNLNKRFETLELELELRPNNNDLSVMSIIQGRRMTMGQSKPGLVVVALEEMPGNSPNANPNQLLVSQLISQRFSGRNGDFSSDTNRAAPRNSDKRGIQKDASLVTLITSNYKLEGPCQDALQRLQILKHLSKQEICAVSGKDRVEFANSYLKQCLEDLLVSSKSPNIDLDITYGKGDTRPLVRYLRMIAFYIVQLSYSSKDDINQEVTPKDICVVQKDNYCKVSVGSTAFVELQRGSFENLFPLKPHPPFHPQVGQVLACLKENNVCLSTRLSELSIILDYWLAKTLAPAVIVSKDPGIIQQLMEAIASLEKVSSISAINADEYKMMKSLYDTTNTPNLRDDILQFGRGAFVSIHLQCPSKDAQLCIREIIEDSPSLTAFSSSKSALYKTGLLFGVHVNGDITPELLSRASIVI